MNRKIALDADGVLLDYRETYARMYELAFGVKPVRNPGVYYHAENQFETPRLNTQEGLDHFYRTFDLHGWTTMKPMPGAVEATKELDRLGWELICVTSMPERYLPLRIQNLKSLGMPIRDSFAAHRHPLQPTHTSNPKAEIIAKINPHYFVDDLADNFLDLPPHIHKVLIDRGELDSPNHRHREHATTYVKDLNHFVRRLAHSMPSMEP